MQGFLLLRALLIAILLKLAQTTSGVVATPPQNVQPQQNLTVSTPLLLPEAPLNQNPINWPIDDIHSLTFIQYTSASPERNYFAALISMQTSIFATYLSSSSPIVQKDEIDYDAYGVSIQIGNYDMILTYAVVSKLLGAVGAFLQKWKKCEATWRLVEKEETDARGRVLSVGVIQRERVWVTNATGMGSASRVDTA